VDHPEFFKALDQAAAANAKMVEHGQSQQPKPVKLLRRLPHVATIAWQIVRLYFMKPIDAGQMRTVVR
jgi:magnesium-protoporphyrin IX monomethyl ester (oxidative) cyclase